MRIGKTGGAVAALALVSVFVFGGIEVAHAAAPVTIVGFTSSGATNGSLVSNGNIRGTADPATTIAVSMTNSGTTSAYCTAIADGLGSWSCPLGAEVPFGSTTFTATDGATSATTTAVTIYGTAGPTLVSPHTGMKIVPYSPVFSGVGPARGSISVVANAGGTVCTVSVVADSGNWSCAAPGTLVDGANGFTVVASTPGYPSDGFYTRTSATIPVTVAELAPPAMDYTIGYATGSSTASISFENGAVTTELYSITEPSGEGNGYSRSSNPAVDCGLTATGPLVCDFGSLAPGIWQVNSTQYLGEMSAAEQNDYFRIPAVPTMTATAQSDQTVAFSGTGTTGDLVTVTATGGSDGGTIVCNATVVASAWSCATAATTPGSHSYHASQLDQGWTPYLDNDSSGNILGEPLGTVLDGRSALTTTMTVTVVAPATPPAAPTMSYTLGYGTGSSTATGAEGSVLYTDLYSVTELEGEGNGYSFDSPVVGCTSGAEDSTTAADATSVVQPCNFGTLAPGIWNVYSWQTVGTLGSPYQNDFFRIPAAPTVTANGNADQTVSFSGTGTTGDLVSVIDETGGAVCSGTVTAGAWSCSAAATPGNHAYRAYQLDQGWTPYTDESGEVGGGPLGTVLSGRSALTTAATATVPAVPVPPATPSPTPTPPPTPRGILNWTLTVAGVTGPLHSGDSATLSSTGLPAGAAVDIQLHSTPIALGSTVVAADGTFSKTVVIPDGVEPGDHHFVVTVTPQGGAAVVVESPVTILPDTELKTLSPTPEPTPASGESNSASGGSTAPHSVAQRNDPATPSAFTDALPTLDELLSSPGAIAGAIGLALAIMLLVAIPTELLNSTVTSNLDRFGSFFTRAEGAIEKAGEWLTRVTGTRATATAVLIIISSIIFGFADPQYGFDLVSLRLTLSLAIAMFIVYYLASLISARIAKARWGVESEISMQPVALIFAIVGVVLGRLLGFSPGFLIGLALGLELANNAQSVHRAKALILRTSVIVGLSLLAWLGYSLIQLWMAGGTETFWTALAQDTLVSVTAEGLTGMVLALLPLSFMEGKELWDHSKLLWAGLFLFTGAAFSLLVLPTAIEGEEVGGSLVAWVLVLTCFTAVALAAWLFLRLTGTSEPGESEKEAEEAEGERVHI